MLAGPFFWWLALALETCQYLTVPINLYNPSGAPVSMPHPFRGVIPPGGRVGIGLEESEFYATIGNEQSLGGLKVEHHPTELVTTADSHLEVIPHTIHFNVGHITTPALAPTPGTPDPNAMAVFGQLNISRASRIEVMHLHLVEDGTSGTCTVEFYRRRSGVMTLLGSVSQSAGAGDYSVNSVVPTTEELRQLLAWDYLYAQLTSNTLLGGASGGDGLTLDVHFSGTLRLP